MTYTPPRIQNYQTIANTAAVAETISTTVEAYPYTEIDYTPAQGSEQVVYLACLNVRNAPDYAESFMNTRLQESTDSGVSWSDIDGSKLFEGSSSPINDYDFTALSYTCLLYTSEVVNDQYFVDLGGGRVNIKIKWHIRSYSPHL